MVKLADLPSDVTGYRVVPDIEALRLSYRSQFGEQAGDAAADSLPLTGWIVITDMRRDGAHDGFVCQRRAIGDGSLGSAYWTSAQIHAVHPPAAGKGAIEKQYRFVLPEMQVVALLTLLSREIFFEAGKSMRGTHLDRLTAVDRALRAQREEQEALEERCQAQPGVVYVMPDRRIRG